MPPLIEVSSLFCCAAGIFGAVLVFKDRPRSAGLQPMRIALASVALWGTVLWVYARSPYSTVRVHLLMAVLCLFPMVWLPAVLSMGERDLRKVLSRWSRPIGLTGLVCLTGAMIMVCGGVDWITGIVSEPAVVLTRAGVWAVAASAVPLAAAMVGLTRRMSIDLRATPALWLSAMGEMGSLLWICTDIMWRGYLAMHVLTAAAALASAAATLGAAALLRGVPPVRPFAPSRRLVYGTAVATLVIAYIMLARFALGWVVAAASAAAPQLLPLGAFVAFSGLTLTLGSTRSRHRLWVAVGRHVFRSKHDYGEVWIHLTGLVSTASSASDLVQRAAQFCRSLLCVHEVSVWLIDSAGRLSPAALVTNDGRLPSPGEAVGTGKQRDDVLAALATGDAASCAKTVGAALACPLAVNGRPMGFIAVGSTGREQELDEEDRRVVRYIAAQLASALGLYQLGEEIAEAREIGSFQKVAAFVLHDLKNLVAQQSFVIENAPRFRGDPEFVADALAAFEDSTNRMRALIGRLRSREPVEAPVHSNCDLLALIRELIALPHIARRAGCSVQLRGPSNGQRCLVPLDGVALAQVLSNLLVNAVESLPADAGEVLLTVAAVSEGWRVDVRDNGRGISEAFLREHLFHPFRTTKEAGFGIGLYECKTIIEGVGGSIDVHSQEHVGTTVTITLPAAVPVDSRGLGTNEERHGKTCSASH